MSPAKYRSALPNRVIRTCLHETVEMELRNDREVLVKPTLMNWEKTNIQFSNHGDVKG